jgi:HAMP domain-containing protein
MKIRTQLVLAFLLLSVLPLTGIVLYSYASSQRAVRKVVEAEAEELTQEMNGRMSTIRAELGRSAERVGEMQVASLMDRQEEELEREYPEVLRAMGESASLVDSLEFTPVAPPAPPATPANTPPAPELPTPVVSGDPTGHSAPHPPVVIDVREILEEVGRARREAGAIQDDPEFQRVMEQAARIAAEAAAGGRVIHHAVPEMPEKTAELERKVRAAEARNRELEARIEKQRKEARLLIGKDIGAPVKKQGRVVGWVRVQVRPEEILSRVLGRARRERGEIPFAVDAEGTVHTASEEDLRKVKALPIQRSLVDSSRQILDGWVVVTSRDEESGLTLGVARPIRQSLEELKRTAARNFGYGLALIAFALVGILPLSNRMTRDVGVLQEGAERIAQGDLGTRVAVRSRNEIGALAAAFNRMAGDLRDNQEKLVEQETEQRLLRSEYERKTRELEEARTFQLSLLPKTLPAHPGFEIAVSMQTATEVGGDYYDFHLSEDGVLTGHHGDGREEPVLRRLREVSSQGVPGRGRRGREAHGAGADGHEPDPRPHGGEDPDPRRRRHAPRPAVPCRNPGGRGDRLGGDAAGRSRLRLPGAEPRGRRRRHAAPHERRSPRAAGRAGRALRLSPRAPALPGVGWAHSRGRHRRPRRRGAHLDRRQAAQRRRDLRGGTSADSVGVP